MSREEWRPVVGQPGYEVSDLGRVRNIKTGYIQRPRPWRSGTVMATFGKDARESVHRVVLRAFVGEPRPGEEGSHLNGDSTDNRLSNLLWEDHLTNMRRKHDHGTVVRGERVNTAKLTEADVRSIRARREGGALLRELAEEFGVTLHMIHRIVKRRAWKHVA